MTPEAEAVLHTKIDRVLKRFGFADCGDAGERPYRVWQMRNGVRFLICENLNRTDAQTLVRSLQAKAIIQLINELAPDARDEANKSRGAA